MEVVESSWNYNLPSQLTPAWAPIVIDTGLRALCALFHVAGDDVEAALARSPPSEDFVVPADGAATVYHSDDGQIDEGVRYEVLLQVLLDFLASDGGASMPKDGIADSRQTNSGGVNASHVAGSGARKSWQCTPCKL